MESLFGPVLELGRFIWGFVSRQIRYARDLDIKKNALSRKADELRHRLDDIQAQVRDAVSVGRTVVLQVENWLKEVDEANVLRDVASIESDFGQGGSCFNGRCPDLRWRHKLGRNIEKKMKVIEQLLQKAVFHNVAESPRRPLMPEFPVPRQLEQQSTSQETLKEIEQALSDEEIGIVSVCGMGGIGKTTLMQKIYNSVAEKGDFNVVIWVTVSKDLDLEVIQKKIGKVLKMEFRDDEGIEDKRRRLHGRLRNVKYMLILDDLWQKFSLDLIGIPQPDKENRCKIAITTRSVEVGNGMEADRVMSVKTLSSVEAWELFRSKTGDVVLQPEIQSLAEEVVRECGGLPLAIKTVGGAMRRKGQKELWQNALRALRAPTSPEVPGMESEVFLPLKLSYDCLEDPKIQSCFLYCSLYPEDYEIDTGYLVRYWAFEEGLINNVSSLDDAENKGFGIIEKLRDACLLEEGPGGDAYVRMHDLLRDLAIWITSPSSASYLQASSSCLQASNLLVKAGERLEQPPEEKMWEGTQRISLMKNYITELQMTPNCPDLVSLFFGENIQLHTIRDDFFRLMPKLQILVLRETGIESLPPSLSQLVNLRVLDASDCRNLQDVPPLGHLKELQRLDLRETGIEGLPQGIASLAKLRSLELSETKALARIPSDIISRLTSLEDLGLCSNKQMMSMEIWREIATLPRLTNLRIVLPNLHAFSANDMKRPIWSRLRRFKLHFGPIDLSIILSRSYLDRTLSISVCEELPIQINGLMEKAEELVIKKWKSLGSLSQIIGDLTSMREAGENNALDRLGKPSLQKAFDGGPPKGFQQLKSIEISACHKLRCIFSSSMLQHLHPLEWLKVENCEGIVEIVEGGALPDTVILPKLKSIAIIGCRELRCIFSSSMLQHLHPLESLRVEDCEEIVEIVEGGPLPDTVIFPKLKIIDIFRCRKLRCIFSSSMLQHLPPLESLGVVDCEEIVEIVEGPLPDTVILPKLKTIGISGCRKLSCIFSSSMLQHLPLLESLTVSDCEEIVEIVEGGPLPDTVILPKLKWIYIFRCRKLRCIFSSSMLQHLHPLESLTVEDCEEIVEIVEGGPLPDTAILPKLKSIRISRCRKLRCIFSSSMLQHLPLLESLMVDDCEEIVEIVEGGSLPDTVILPKLKSIAISGCRKLRCIFSSSMLQHLPLLESLTVENCEEIVETVDGGPLPDTVILPKLKHIGIFGCRKLSCIFSSSFLQHLQLLESLEIYDCEEIVEIVEGGPLPDTVILPKLKSIDISHCRKLRCIFSSSMLQHLQSLESLEIENCEEMVEIVEGGPPPDTALQSLKELNLVNLPKLTAICSQQLVLTSMDEIWIEYCPELKKLPVLCSGIQQIRGLIGAARDWWEGIEWEDEHSKSLYSTIYKEKQGDDDEEATEPEPAKEAEAASER